MPIYRHDIDETASTTAATRWCGVALPLDWKPHSLLESGSSRMASCCESTARALRHRYEIDLLRARFMKTISSELRSRLDSIQTNVRRARNGSIREELDSYFRELAEHARRVNDLIEDAIEMTAPDSYLSVGTWARVEVIPVIQTAVCRFQNQAKSSGVSLGTSRLPASLPHVGGDDGLLTLALSELVENGLVFTPAGGRVTISAEQIEARDRRTWVRIAVRDTGPGILPTEQERIFDCLYRGEQAEASEIRGSGMGLAICKDILEGHGGGVTVESELGRGSTFYLSIPALKSAQSP